MKHEKLYLRREVKLEVKGSPKGGTISEGLRGDIYGLNTLTGSLELLMDLLLGQPDSTNEGDMRLEFRPPNSAWREAINFLTLSNTSSGGRAQIEYSCFSAIED
ncbi:hypothetical protein Ancab_005527 [Ancistrocladus abbreviatus]